ncbi:MAG: FtsX-like permease family protein, partial [Oscillospiraceae bacterium]|nr:FtsX-like permease family protein [Oscillospiraceae bacterium]
YKVIINDLSKYNETVTELNALDSVLRVRENSDLAGKLVSVRNAVTYMCMGIIALLFAVAVFIIGNTIRITMFSRKLEISIMKAVGATNWFIRWPFIIEGMVLGLISVMISYGLLYILYSAVANSFATVMLMFSGDLVSFGDNGLLILVIYVFIGVFTGTIGSIMSIGKYLREQGSVISD